MLIILVTGCADNDDNATYYSISFDANGGTGTMKTITTLQGHALRLPEVTFTKKGATFKNWNAVAKNTQDKTNDKSSNSTEILDTYSDKEIIRVTQSVKLIAQWKTN